MPTAIRTTHTGSLPRSPELVDLLIKRDRAEPVVKRQHDIGLAVVNDGEMSKMTYATYLRFRVSGFKVVSRRIELPATAEARKYPMWWEEARKTWLETPYVALKCHRPLKIVDTTLLQTGLRNLRAAAEKSGATELFMTAASPGIIANYIPNS